MSVGIKLTIPQNLFEQSKQIAQSQGYANIQELTLEGLRRINQELETVQMLRKFQSKTNNIKITRAQRKQAFLEYEKISDSQILRELNLEDIRKI